MTEWILSSSVLILAVMALRLVLKGKISLRLQYSLWALVLVRLLFPFSIGTSAISVSNLPQQSAAQEATAELERYESAYREIEDQYLQSGMSVDTAQLRQEAQEQIYEQTYQQVITDHAAESVSDTQLAQETLQRVESISLTAAVLDALPCVWYAGMILVGAVLLVSNLHFGWKLRRTRQALDIPSPLSVYFTEAVATPCLFGFPKPAIYLTGDALEDSQAQAHALAHELSHYRQGDHLWSMLRCVCLVLHWYNPLVWAAAILSKRDAELACDEATIRTLGESQRLAYGQTLIGMTCIRRDPRNLLLTATTMLGSKKSLKERVALIAKKPRTALYTLIACVLVAAIAVGCTFTGPSSTLDKDQVWEKLLTAIEKHNSQSVFYAEWTYCEEGKEAEAITNTLWKHERNEYLITDQPSGADEYILRLNGTLYTRHDGSGWQDLGESGNGTDLTLSLPDEENLVLSWTEENGALTVVCDSSFAAADETSTVTFTLDKDGTLTQALCRYGIHANGLDCIEVLTMTIHDTDSVAIDQKLLDIYADVADELGLEPITSLLYADEVQEMIRTAAEAINSRAGYHFSVYSALHPMLTSPVELDFDGAEKVNEGWKYGEDFYLDIRSDGETNPHWLLYDKTFYSHLFDNVWIVDSNRQDPASDSAMFDVPVPSTEDHTVTWKEADGYLEVTYEAKSADPDDGIFHVIFRLDPEGDLVWFATSTALYSTDAEGKVTGYYLYSIQEFHDTAEDAIRQKVEDSASAVLSGMVNHLDYRDETEPTTAS